MTAYVPICFPGVMISSTFCDLAHHRAALIRALDRQGLKVIAMEHSCASAEHDLIDSSLKMVRDSSAYILVIGKRYGQVPICPRRNPRQLSITELEFEEAQRLGRPILLFLMGEDHLIRESDIESTPARKHQLAAFRERAKLMGPDCAVSRIYESFNDLGDFTEKALGATAHLRRTLEALTSHFTRSVCGKALPTEPPEFRAEPPYIGSHHFVGRRSQLEQIDDWCSSSDPSTILLFDGIGGAGKSILTWEWATKHAPILRRDWAGRFWFSFYERGAVMSDLCRQALSYMTGEPVDHFKATGFRELGERLLAELRARPWLLILDGIERILAAYNHHDPARIADQDADAVFTLPGGDPCACILSEDAELLRALTRVTPSKILITTRIVPRALLNPAGVPLPGVQRVSLKGLRPQDAEVLFRSCGIRGTSTEIQHYLRQHFDCHPLIIGVLAGLVNDYLPARGDFDAWVRTEHERLNLADLDLTQKRNHILNTALDSLSDRSRQLLSMLALLSGSADYDTLCAFNPHLSPLPAAVAAPRDPRGERTWRLFTPTHQRRLVADYELTLAQRRAYENAVRARSATAEVRGGQPGLARTVRDLEARGLLQFDAQSKRYDLHPVVRGITAGRLTSHETEDYGARLITHFSCRPKVIASAVKSIGDVLDDLQVIRTYLRMGRLQQVAPLLTKEIARPLYENLEAHALLLSLVRPYFPNGWHELPTCVSTPLAAELAHIAGRVLAERDTCENACIAFLTAIRGFLLTSKARHALMALINISHTLQGFGHSAKANRVCQLTLQLASRLDDGVSGSSLIAARLCEFNHLVIAGRWDTAEAVWTLIHSDPAELRDFRAVNPGDLEHRFAQLQFSRGTLQDEHLRVAELLTRAGHTERFNSRRLHWMRGLWHLDRGENALAAESLEHAQRMTREARELSPGPDAYLLLARYRLGQTGDIQAEIERLIRSSRIHTNAIAELYLETGERAAAERYARRAYELALHDGEPYVYRYELDRASRILTRLGVATPAVRTYDPERAPHDQLDERILQGAADVHAAVERAIRCRRLRGPGRKEGRSEPDVPYGSAIARNS